MNNLTTRKIVLGLLVTLVLAFSVQGTADAYELTRSTNSIALLPIPSSGTTSEQSFTFGIRFSQAEVDADDGGNPAIPTRYSIAVSNVTSLTVSGLTDSDQDDSTATVDPTSTRTYTVTAKYILGASGKTEFAVTVTTATLSGGGNPVYTAYGVLRASQVRTFNFEDTAGTTNPKIITVDSNTNNEFYLDHEISVSLGATADNAVVEFQRIWGPGQLYENLDDDNTRLDPGRRLSTSANGVVQNGTASVRLRLGNGSSRIRASIRGANLAEEGKTLDMTFFYDGIRLVKVSGEPQVGTHGTQLTDPLVVEVRDWYPNPLSGTAIRDQEIAFTTTAAGITRVTTGSGTNIRLDSDLSDTAAGVSPHPDSPDVDNNANLLGVDYPRTVSDYPRTGIRVITNNSGQAKVYAVVSADTTTPATSSVFYAAVNTNNDNSFGNTGDHRASFSATIEAVETDAGSIEIESGNGQTGVSLNRPAPDPLVVIVRDGNGLLEQGKNVTFTTDNGVLLPPGSDDPGTHDTTMTNDSRSRTVSTDNTGRASVRFNVGNTSGGKTVRATINNGAQHVIFGINGGRTTGGGTNQQQQQQQQQQTGSLTISVTGTGTTRTVTVTATSAAGTPTAIPVVLTGTALGSTQTVTTGTATEITLPTAPGTYTLTATASVAGYNPDTGTITVAGPTSLGTISITQIGAPTNGLQTFSVTVVDTNGNRISGALTVTVSGSGFTTSSVPTANGSGAVNITLPTTAGSYTLTARATDYTSGTTTVRIAGTTPTTTPTPTTTTPTTPTTPTVSEPDSVSIVGPSQRDGTANTALDAALIVQVVDDDGDAVADARVIFRVRTGQGRLSDRGNGRAIAVQTNSSGHARATYTPISASSTVEAEVRGVTRSVTFTITASGGSTTPTTRDTGTGMTPGTISPTVLVGAANRAPMLWIDGGAIYSLVGASVERFAPSVDNAQNLAVGGGKVYWTEATGESGGTINAANLNGSGVTELAAILATPMGIAIDTAGSKLYWTNSRGKIQSANLNGSGITDVIPSGLEGAMDIALAGGNAYWTQGGNVRFVNLRGQKQIRNVSTGTDTAGSLAIAGGKVYWTEATGESGGTVNSANLNGSGATQLASILAAPSGIAVDTARSKLLWTNARGRIQSANLDGSGITNVVDGLGSPGDMVLSNSISAPAATTTTTTTTASKAKYDVNGDGSVDNTDASLVAAAMNTTNAKYDVNSDGVVNFLDLLLVFDNRDATAASAPTIVGMKLTAVQVDVLQEQINLLIATGDRSPAAMRTLVYLQQLIATARPEQTQLLANYPNPFNPETWIPYELATDTEVRITIYNTQGVVIRTLELGHRSSGYYVGRDRAAYWDGRNAFGEQVASGIYFYQFETDETSSMRKMVILK